MAFENKIQFIDYLANNLKLNEKERMLCPPDAYCVAIYLFHDELGEQILKILYSYRESPFPIVARFIIRT